MALSLHFSLCSDEIWQTDTYLSLTVVTDIMAQKAKIVLEEI